MKLSDVKNGKVMVVKIDAGEGLSRRLSAMGVYEGTSLEVDKNDMNGPVIIKVLDSKLLIGRGQAEKILVQTEKSKRDFSEVHKTKV